MFSLLSLWFFFFFNAAAATEIYTLSLTTLFRSRRSHEHFHLAIDYRVTDALRDGHSRGTRDWTQRRSEEHTSELQSRRDLVCRLLLEKKKKASPTPRPRSCPAP